MKRLRYLMPPTVRRVGTHMRHNEIRDTFAKIMEDVCYDVEAEPTHQSEFFIHKTTSTYENPRLDIKAYGGPGSAVVSST